MAELTDNGTVAQMEKIEVGEKVVLMVFC